MGGLWRYDKVLKIFSELASAGVRTSTGRHKFYRNKFEEPLQSADPDELTQWKSADITERGHLSRATAFVVVAQSSHTSTPPMEPPPTIILTAFEESPYQKLIRTYRDMSDTTRRLAALPPDDFPSEIMANGVADCFTAGTLLCVSDGSFNPNTGRGSHAWILTSSDKQAYFQGVGPVDGDPRIMSAYRPELQGLLATVIALSTIEVAYTLQHGAHATLICDNEAATVELLKIVTDGNHVIDPHQTDYDVLLEIQGIITLSSARYTIQWIKGHQEDVTPIAELGFLALLNINCDHRAKTFLRSYVADPVRLPVIFAHEKWGAICAGEKITADLKNAIFENYTAPITQSYLQKKFKWDAQDIDKVAWQSVHFAKLTLPMRRNTFVAKCITILSNRWN
jgi:ribonuclease HI